MANPIKLELLVRGIKQVDVARKAGVSKSYIGNVIAGRDKPSERVRQAFLHFGIKLRGVGGEDDE